MSFCKVLVNIFPGVEITNNSVFPSEECQKDLPVRHYFCPSLTNRQREICMIPAFPSEKCLKFLLVRLHFHLSDRRTVCNFHPCNFPCDYYGRSTNSLLLPATFNTKLLISSMHMIPCRYMAHAVIFI